jgi:histone-lysine N-methyltransferase SETMAR
MEKHEQGFVIKFFWMRGLGPSAIYQKLQNTIGSTADSEDSVENWVRRFVSRDTSCVDLPRAGRPPTDLSEPLRNFLNDFPFTTARMMSRQFSARPSTINEILRCDLGLKKFARRWILHQLNPSQKVQRVEAAKLLLQILQMFQPTTFDEIATGDESWFQYVYMSNSTFAPSRDLAATRTKDADRTTKTMLTVFFTSGRLIVLKALPKRTTFTQHYFISDILPDLDREKLRYRRKNPGQGFFLHTNNSKCHNAKKITENLQKKHITRAPHQLYSPELSPCDFWFFGMVKQKIKDREFCSAQEMLSSLSDAWSDHTFEDIQRVFFEWMDRLTWILENDGEYFPK